MSSPSPPVKSSLFPSGDKSHINAICIGSGRFLRSVLVPALIATNTIKPIIIQTRGRSFMDYCEGRVNKDEKEEQHWTYEVDTVQHDGTIQSDVIPCYGAGTLGTTEGKDALLKQMIPYISSNIQILGVGVTEAGLSSSSTKAVRDLYDILKEICQCRNGDSSGHRRISVINTDNIPHNGDLLEKFLMEVAEEEKDNDNIKTFLKDSVSFHNTMVDRITSQRPDSNGLVPRAEPTPAKALVIEDLKNDLPKELSTSSSNGSSELESKYGVVVRTKPGQLNSDIALKLRVANGTHTAVAHVMALCQLLMTDALSKKGDGNNDNPSTAASAILMKYLDSFFYNQIAKGVEGNKEQLISTTTDDATYVYDDWRKRLIHAHFGLSSFFITQNGAAKGGIRIGPTVVDLLMSGQNVSCATVFALAAILRFLTPARPTAKPVDGVYKGWLDGCTRDCNGNGSGKSEGYADGLSYNLEEGWYEFRCACNIVGSECEREQPLSVVLGSLPTTMQPVYYEQVIRAYLTKGDGGDLSTIAEHPCTKDSFNVLVRAVAVVYARMIAGDGMLNILRGMELESKCDILVDGMEEANNSKKRSNSHLDDYRPLHYRQSSIPSDSRLLNATLGDDRDAIRSVVFSEVQSALTIDLHTHLLPPSHGALCLWGIDELLTYHYLVAEYFMTAPPSVTPEIFYAQSKQIQADMIWEALFIHRSPVSEACRGVITTLLALGLHKEVMERDLYGIRKFYSKFRDAGVDGAEEYSTLVYKKCGVRYAVMTNIPFDPTETQHWRPKPKEYSNNFRAALRVDPLLAGDKKTIENALAAAGYSNTMEGARQYLHDWCETMKPEYMMASTPHDFVLPEDSGPMTKASKTGVNEDAMKEPFAFTDLTSNSCITDCDGGEDTLPSVIDEDSDFLTEVLMKVCEERDLPIALKIGAHRQVNPSLLQAGDGVVAFADSNVLARLCTRFPRVRFLATFLSKNNQHEACVLATKFRNLHIYGCWWFCNNPSIIEEITKMRMEMLGNAFTAQHSDSRVLDQLIYKWAHSRAIIANVLSKEYSKLIETGWTMNRKELRRDIQRLFGVSYEEFMKKSLSTVIA